MKRLLSCLAVGVAFQYLLGGVSGCSSADPVKQKSAPIGKRGTLSMSLESTSDSGKVYRLRNATFLVNSSFFEPPFPTPPPFGITGSSTSGFAGGVTGGGIAFPDAGIGFAGSTSTGGSPVVIDGGFGGFIGTGGTVGIGGTGGAGGTTFFPTGGSLNNVPGSIVLNSEDNPSDPVIQRFLSPGSYDIELLSGWFVEQVDDLLGTSAPVPATLESPEFQFFSIQSDRETFVKYDFLVDGSRVSFGPPGRLIIGIGIHETNGNASCGDGIVQQGEDCDGPNLGGQTCASVTMNARPSGTLFCNAKCVFDTTFCQGGGIIDGGTGGFGTGGFSATGGSVGLPSMDGGVVLGAGGASGKKPAP